MPPSPATGFEPGAFDRRVEVLRVRASATVGADGEIDLTRADSWEVWRTRWARILPRSSREFWRLEQVDAQVSHVIQMLWDSDSAQITTDMRIRYKGRVFELSGKTNVDEADRLAEFTATERIA